MERPFGAAGVDASQSRPRWSRRGRRRGAVLILVLLLLVLLFAGIAFSVDVAVMQLTRTQLRAAADAAAVAATEALNRTHSEAQARQAAKDIAVLNLVGGKPLLLADTDIVFGKMQTVAGTPQFTPGMAPFDAVRVTADFSATSRSGEVDLYFGRMFHRGSFSPKMVAAAAIGIPKRDLCVVVDRSGSMTSSGKWSGLLVAFDYLVQGMNSTADVEQLGLASYSTDATIDRRLSTDYAAVRTVLRSKSPSGYTNIHDGMMCGIAILTDGTRRTGATPVMVIMTDGIYNRGPDPVAAAEHARNSGIACIAITFGTDADQTTMRRIAEITQGKFYHAPSSADLQAIFNDIGANKDGVYFAE